MWKRPLASDGLERSSEKLTLFFRARYRFRSLLLWNWIQTTNYKKRAHYDEHVLLINPNVIIDNREFSDCPETVITISN
jgi:hypothetical protein